MIQTKEVKKLCPIEGALETNEKLIQKLERKEAQNTAPEPVKKKAPTEPQKGNWSFLRTASLGAVLLLSGYFLATGTGVDVIDSVVAFIQSFDPFKPFRGGNELSPSDFVMLLNN